MIDTLDKVIETAKKLRKFAKKSADPAFVNLIADLNVELAELRVELAESRTAAAVAQTAPAATASAPDAGQPATPALGRTTTSSFDATLNSVFGDDRERQ